jgi:hypothetical protein
VLILDELGYLACEAGTGALLYELIAQRYERRATVITSNKSLPEWGRVLNDTALAGALIDRLMHHGDVYYLKGPSYRLRDKNIVDHGNVPALPMAESPSLEPTVNHNVMIDSEAGRPSQTSVQRKTGSKKQLVES